MAGRKRRKEKRDERDEKEKTKRDEKKRDEKKRGKKKRDKKKSEKRAEREKEASAAETRAIPTSRGWAALAELLGRRAAVRVLWELRSQPLRFRPLQSACDDLSPSTLNQRLAELREAGLVALDESAGYALTPMGREVVIRLTPLAVWAEPWSHRRAQKRTPATALRRQ